jgi:hypothetical protein
MSFFKRLDSLDRRWIFVFQMVVFCVAIMRPVGLALDIGDQTTKAFETIDALPPGSIVWFGMDYQAAAASEIEPTGIAVFRHCMEKNLRVVAGGMWPEGGAMMERLIAVVAPDFPDKQYGVDYLNLGYRPGGQVWLQQLTVNLPDAVGGVDYFGDPIDSYPLAKSLTKIQDVDLIFGLTIGTPGTPEYIKMVTDPYNVPMIAALPASSVAITMPYLGSGQLVAMLASLRGGAEYEKISGNMGSAMTGMDIQSFMNLTIVIFVILGNVGYFVNKRANGGGKGNV